MPGCPVQPDNFMETLIWLLSQAAGKAPPIPLDEQLRPDLALRQDRARGLRPRRLLRAGRLRPDYNSPKCQVKVGCWGPVVNCNVTKRGWMGGIGGCPNVGGICIGCTMPGFPDKFMPFMDQPPGGRALLGAAPGPTARMIRRLRGITNHTVNEEPKWRHNGPELTTGYDPRWAPATERAADANASTRGPAMTEMSEGSSASAGS